MTDPIEDTDAPYGADAARASRGRRIAVGLGVIAVVAGGLFAVLSLGGDSNSPEDPVRAMFEAAEQGDVLGILEQLDPGERDALREPLLDIADELDRLEVLKDADLGGISGIEVQIEDLQLASRRVADDIARVTITGGKSRVHVDVSKLPLGPFVRDLLGDANEEVTDESESLASENADDFVATVRRDGRWYVSIGYSFAERSRQGKPFDELGGPVAARGADSPEEAVRELIEAGAGLDVRRVIELLAPDELAALHDYAGLFLPSLEAEIAAEARDKLHVTIPTLELDADTDGDHSLVTVEEIAVEGRAESNTFSIRDGCYSLSGADLETTKLCPGDRPTDMLGLTPFGFFGVGRTEVEPPELSFIGKQPRVGFVATRVDGKWYVSPVRTFLESLLAVMRLAEPRDLDAIRDYFERLNESFTSSFDEQFLCLQPSEDVPSPDDCDIDSQVGRVEEEHEPTATTYSQQ